MGETGHPHRQCQAQPESIESLSQSAYSSYYEKGQHHGSQEQSQRTDRQRGGRLAGADRRSRAPGCARLFLASVMLAFFIIARIGRLTKAFNTFWLRLALTTWMTCLTHVSVRVAAVAAALAILANQLSDQ